MFIHDAWVGIGPFKFYLTSQLLLIAVVAVALLAAVTIVAVAFLLRKRRKT